MRAASLILGIFVLALIWLVPFQKSFSSHMTAHMGLVAVAAPLLALGVIGGKFDPVPYAPGVFSALWASLVEFFVVWAWHMPTLHHAARHTNWRIVEQVMFLLSGLFLWLSALGGSAQRGRVASGIAALLLTSMHMTLLGALLALASRPLYHHAHHSSLSPLQDQHLGGAIMLLVGGASYLLGGLCLASVLLRDIPKRGHP